MERIEYRGAIDKSDWAIRGEWDNEPDKVQWQDEATGLPCLIVRGPAGALCGYVGVPEGHPLHGVGYSECPKGCGEDHCSHSPESTINAHGGLTFADSCNPKAKEDRGICHKPAPGEPDHVWWFGFDCAHAGDFCPMFEGRYYTKSTLGMPTGWGTVVEYRNIAYVTEQCRGLAQQLAARMEITHDGEVMVGDVGLTTFINRELGGQ